MLLSIGMIVKNEEKYLEQCLTALKPILDNVDSELIIADTGSTDNTVEIAKKFTDNVFHFEWINDFAAARNSTLDKAKGEWYMFIDADEIIKDCTELIEFFNSGEYKKYGSANYVVRNYNDLSVLDLFDDFRAPRLTALQNGVRFYKAIHENFNQVLSPIKYLDVIADHYGYVYKEGDKVLDVAEKKTSRNLELLFKELEEGEKNGNVVGTVYGQIADCYIWINDLDNALKYIDMGLEKVSRRSYTRLNYYTKKAKVLQKQEKYDEIIELCKEYFSKDNDIRTGQIAMDCNIYFSWSIAAFFLGRYDEAIAKAVQGFDVYRKYTNGKLNTDDLIYCMVEVTIPQMKQMCNILLIACNVQKKYNIAAEILKNVPLKDFLSDSDYMRKHVTMRLELMEYTNYNKMPELFYQMDKPNKEMFVTAVIRNIFKTSQRGHFLKKLAVIANDSERLADMLEIFNEYYVNRSLSEKRILEFIEKHGVIDNEVALILMMMNGYDITPFILAEGFDSANSMVAVFTDYTNPNSAMSPLINYRLNRLSPDGLDKAIEMYGQALLVAMVKKYNVTKLLAKYGTLGEYWVYLHPDEEVPENIRSVLTVNEIAELHRKKNYVDCVELIGTLCSTDGFYVPLMEYYLNIVKTDAEKNLEMMEKHNADPMLMALAEEIKEGIREMIADCDIDGAENALEQMAMMAPFDSEIEDLRDEINDLKNSFLL